uniref:Uncharacterized protein n=1 Tax=Ixodes ricinus TaxID=34613 RepID=V5HNB9_IXORI
MSSLVRFLRQGWREWPELVIMGGIVLAVCPPAIYSSYKLHYRTWHYRTEYTVVRDDDVLKFHTVKLTCSVQIGESLSNSMVVRDDDPYAQELRGVLQGL